jgi:hypothetical protein
VAWGTSVSRRCWGWFLAFLALAVLLGSGRPAFPDRSDAGRQVLMGKRIVENGRDQARSTTGPQRPSDAGPDLFTEALGFEKVTIPGVPRYLWHNGCGPTAAGMVIGYWDGRGFDDLVPGDAGSVTPRTRTMVSSPGNYHDYCVSLDSSGPVRVDLSEEPTGDEHADDSLADFMKTSQSYHGNNYGWSWNHHVDDALLGYVRRVNPAYDPSYARVYHGAAHPDTIWFALVREVDAGHPAVFMVDSNGDGRSDHFVTAVGYDKNHNYGFYDTWDRREHWQPLAPVRGGNKWGVHSAHFLALDGFDWTPGALSVEGSLTWTGVEPGERVAGTLRIANSGPPESGLFWRVAGLPDWGVWEWDPAEGLNLRPEEGVEKLTVSVIAPNRPGVTYRGTLVFVNAEKPDAERFEVEVSLATVERSPGKR